MKALIFDSGTLINLSMNGLLYILEDLRKSFDGKFLITSAVKYEVIDHPIKIQRFELEALLIKGLLDSNILELPSAFEIDENKIKEGAKQLMQKANHTIKIGENWVDIVSEAEISCLALSDELSRKGIDSLIGIDERTTRILCENSQNLGKLMSEKLHQKVIAITDDLKVFSKYKFIRSSEIVYVAYKKKIVNIKGDKVLEALLYATKYKGAAISLDEINILKKM